MRNRLAVVALGLILGCPGESSSPSGEGPPPPPGETIGGSGLCLPSGFCWENPLPQGNAILGLWGASASDVWAVGGRGNYVTHFDGTRWSAVALPATVTLSDVHGASATDVWAVGTNGAAMHWDGASWASAPWTTAGASAEDVFVAANGDAYVATQFNGIRRRPAGTASAWSTASGSPSGYLYSVWGVGTDYFWGSGDSRYWGVSSDGANWTFTQLAGLTNVTDVWASAADDLWRIHGGEVERSTDGGGTWVGRTYGLDEPAWALWGSSATDLWALGAAKAHHQDGTAWTGLPHGLVGYASALWGTAQSAWIGGDAGRLSRFDGSSFVVASGGVRDVSLLRLSATGSSDAWAYVRENACTSCAGAIWRRDATGWRRALALQGVSTAAANPLWARAPDDVWFASHSLAHWNGSNWSYDNRRVSAEAIHGSGATDVWMYAYDNVAMVTSLWRWNGSTWTERPLPGFTSVHSIHAIAPDDVWVAGRNAPQYSTAVNKLAHWDGSAWTEHTYGSPNPYLSGIWAAAADDVWFVGSGGTILHWDGGALGPVASGTNMSLKAISGSAANDVWAVGDLGTVRHWDGMAWSDGVGGADRFLTSVAAVPGHVWIAGADAILHKQ